MSNLDHIACGYNCFGRANFSSLALQINCNSNYSELSSCMLHELDSSLCQSNAGVFCGKLILLQLIE